MKRNVLWIAVGIAIGSIAMPGFAQRGGTGGGGGGGGGEPPTTEAVNNLSYPAVLTAAGVTLPGLPGQWTLNGIFPTSMSYGCATPQVIGTSTYPNTSCVTTTGEPLPLHECGLICGTVPVERIYWQKQPANAWQAENFVATPGVAEFVDWGDNLESVSWSTTSVIRVETTPFAVVATPQIGFQMWHVFGQGPSELWGVRATNPVEEATLPVPIPTRPPRSVAATGPDGTTAYAVEAASPYGYTTTYAIIRSPNARLGLAKLSPAADACVSPSPYAASFPWDSTSHAWLGATASFDVAYTPELNIGGKFVYGYNWKTRDYVMPAGVEKAGWWRLTFYAPDVLFTPTTVTSAPVLPDSAPMTPYSALIARITEEEAGPLYTPVVDAVNQITYIDICLTGARGGSGGGGSTGGRR